jgi:multiple sugar transport system substrate-binding protein
MPRAGATSELVYLGYDYRDDLTRTLIGEFESTFSDVRIEPRLAPIREYRAFAEQLLHKGARADVIYLGEEELAGWVTERWLRPLDGLPGLEPLTADLYESVREAMSLDGALYGLPAYAGFQVFVCNTDLLRRAGLDARPMSLGEVRDQALELKHQGIAEFPLVLAFGEHPLLFFDFWALVFASGGSFFDDECRPVFDQPDAIAVAVLEWLVDALYTWKILDPASINYWHDEARDVLASGCAVFTSVMQYVLKMLNEPRAPKLDGAVAAILYPGLGPECQGTLAWARMYGLSARSGDPDAAWRFLRYFGGLDDKGRYTTAEAQFAETDVGFGYASLWDSERIRQAASWCDIDLYRAQQERARGREGIQAPWWREWERFHQECVRQALRRDMHPAEALAVSGSAARRLAARLKRGAA